VIDFYQRWYDTPIEPAYRYNARRPPLPEIDRRRRP
jgi:hypothetical protein